MLHYSCDVCKRPIDAHADVRHVVKIEVFPAVEEASIDSCCHGDPAGAEADHLEAMQELLEQMADNGADHDLSGDDGTRSMRFDLCDACRQRFVKNPLGMKPGKHFDFSNN